MPRLLLFGPCQRAIIDRTDTTVSMIAIMNHINIHVDDPNDPIPADAYAPFVWATVAVWERLPEDADRTFEQAVQIELPDGQRVGEGSITFTLERRTHQNMTNGADLPIGQAGMYRFLALIREPSVTSEWTEAGSYPLEVTHVRQEG